MAPMEPTPPRGPDPRISAAGGDPEQWHATAPNAGNGTGSEQARAQVPSVPSMRVPPTRPRGVDRWRCVACRCVLDPVLMAEGAYVHPTCTTLDYPVPA